MTNENSVKRRSILYIILFELVRIRTVISWCAFSCIGFILGMSTLTSVYFGRFAIFLTSTLCVLSFTFAINNYYDINSDRINPKKCNLNAMASGHISKTFGIVANLALVILALLIVTFSLDFSGIVFCAFFIFWMWVYSSPPLRLKGRPGVDILWHFVAFAILVLWGSFVAGSIGLSTWLVAISLGVFSCVAQVWNHLNDYQFDKESGIVTYAVSRGVDNTIMTLKIIVILQTVLLLPLIFLYSLQYVFAVAVLIVGILLGIYVVHTKWKTIGYSAAYYFPIVFSFAVYINAITYHLALLVGQPATMYRL